MDVVINYSYPWLPPRCSHCQKWGHSKETCLASSVLDKSAIENSPKSKGQGDKVQKLEKSTTGQAKINTNPTTDSPTHGTEESQNKSNEQTIPPAETEDQDWTVPHNIGRSPAKKQAELKFGEVTILPNPYSALCEEGEIQENKLNDETDLEDKKEDAKKAMNLETKGDNVEALADEANLTIGNLIKHTRKAKGTRQYLP